MCSKCASHVFEQHHPLLLKSYQTDIKGGKVGYSVGIGLTNDCNLNCAHCYRDTQTISAVSLAQVKKSVL